MSATSSPWTDTTLPSGNPLTSQVTCDVCVIGAGIAGLTAAYLLANTDRSVVLLEANDTPASGETMFTTAHLAWVLDDPFAPLASVRGAEVARSAAESHRSAIDLIHHIVVKERIECEFERYSIGKHTQKPLSCEE